MVTIVVTNKALSAAITSTVAVQYGYSVGMNMFPLSLYHCPPLIYQYPSRLSFDYFDYFDEVDKYQILVQVGDYDVELVSPTASAVFLLGILATL
jgi:hypothetical protein